MHLYKVNFFVGTSVTLLIQYLILIPSTAGSETQGSVQITNQSVSSLATNATDLVAAPGAERKKQEDAQDFEGVVNSHDVNKNGTNSISGDGVDSESQCVEDAILKGSNGEILSSEVDICKSVSLQCIHDSLQKLLEDPAKQVSGQDYACILLNLLQRNTEYASSVANLESNLKSTQDQLQSLSQSLDSHAQKFIPVEKLAHFEKLEKSTSTFEANAARRVSKLEGQFSDLSEIVSSSEKKHKEGDAQLRKTVADNKKEFETLFHNLNASLTLDADAFETALTELNQIGGMWSEISSSVQEIQTRNSQNEVEIVSKITEITTNLTNLAIAVEKQGVQGERKESSLRKEFLENLSSTKEALMDDYKQKIHACQESYSAKMTNLTLDWNEHKAEIQVEMENATRNLKEMLEVPFKTVESLGAELTSKLETEVDRALRAESVLASSLLNYTTMQEVNFKTLLQSEVKRSSLSEVKLLDSISQVKSSMSQMKNDIQAGIDLESLRAKGTEAQLSSIIVKEVEKVRKEQGEVKAKLETLGNVLIQETKRALNAEEALLDNVNQELKRASEREGELHEMYLSNGEKITATQDDLKLVKELVDKEIEYCNQVVNINTNVNEKLEKVEEHGVKLAKLEIKVDAEVERATDVELGIFKEIRGWVQQAKATETRIVSEMTSGSEKIDLALASQVNLTTFLGEGLKDLKSSHERDVTEIGGKFGTFTTLLESEVEKVGSLVRGIETNFTVHLLTLADETDLKLDTLGRKVDSRFDLLESDVKELNAFKNATLAKEKKPTPPPSSGGVFNRIVGFFGGNRRTTAAASNSTSPKSGGKKGKKSGDEDDLDDLVAKRLRVDDVFENDGEEETEAEISEQEAELISGLSSGPRGKSAVGGRGKSMGGNRRRAAPAEIPFMQRSNSRIRNMYG